MKNRKRCLEVISFYNHTGMERRFEEMAKKGWMIEGISNFGWTYRKIKPRELHFSVVYYPKASDFDPGPSWEQQTFGDFCARTGWKMVANWHQMQVFCNEQENPIPIETDPVMELQSLHSACMKNFIPAYILLLALGLFQAIGFLVRLFSDPIGVFSGFGHLLAGVGSTSIVLLSAVELLAYFGWYIKAKKAAQYGVFEESPNTVGFQKAILALALVFFAGWLLDLALSGDPLYWLAGMMALVFYIAMLGGVNAIKQGLKKAGAPRGLNKTVTFLACLLAPLVLSGAVVGLVLTADESGWLESAAQEERIPLRVSDLEAVDDTNYIEHNDYNRSILLQHRTVFHYRSNTSNDRLVYTVTRTGIPWLYEMCKEQYIEGQLDWKDPAYEIAYVPIDPAQWGAVEAWRQLDENGIEKTSFLLCYDHTIVLIHLDFEPTREQKQVIAQKLNH